MKFVIIVFLLFSEGANAVKFEDQDIGGKETGAVMFDYHGDKEKAMALTGEGRALLGSVKNRMRLGGLAQLQDEIRRDNNRVVIFASSIKGQGGSADIDRVSIFVDKDKEGEEYQTDIITGFIVQMTRTSMEWIWSVPYALEPGIDSDGPSFTDKSGWVYPWPYTSSIFPDSGNITPFSWNTIDNWLPEMKWLNWTGFSGNGFAIRFDPDANQETVLYDLSLHQLESDTAVHYPPTGPRVGTVAVGAPEDFVIAFGHFLSTEVSAPYITINGPVDDGFTGSYMLNVDGVHSSIVDGDYATDDYSVGNDGPIFMRSNHNYLMAARSSITKLDKNEYLFDTPASDGGQRFSYYNHPYASVALLPEGSTVSAAFEPYDYGADPDYDDWYQATYVASPDANGEVAQGFAHYQTVFRRALDEGAAMPHTIGTNIGDPPGSPLSSMQTNLFPNNWMHPLTHFIDYLLRFEYTFNAAESTGKPDTVAKPGYYKVHIPSFDTVGGVISGVEYDLDITLFGSAFLAKTKLSGITGEKNDKLKILVGIPITFKKGDADSLFTQAIIQER
jgi:hypothetical protein